MEGTSRDISESLSKSVPSRYSGNKRYDSQVDFERKERKLNGCDKLFHCKRYRK